VLTPEDETNLLISSSANPHQQQQQQPVRRNHDNDDDDVNDMKRRSSAGTCSQSSDSQTDYANTAGAGTSVVHSELGLTCH